MLKKNSYQGKHSKPQHIINRENRRSHYIKLAKSDRFSFLYIAPLLIGLIATIFFPNSFKQWDAAQAALKTPSDYSTSQNLACVKKVRQYKPSWAPDWKIYCTKDVNSFSALTGSGKPTTTSNSTSILGLTLPSSHQIAVTNNSSTSTDAKEQKHVVVHEYTHAAIRAQNLMEKDVWKRWTNYLNKTLDTSPGLSYYSDPNEVLADSVATCYLHENYKILFGFPTIPCREVYKYFPQFNNQ